MIPKFRQVLKSILAQSGCIGFERFDGTLALATLDVPASVTRNLANSEILLDGQKQARFSLGYSPARNLITGLEIMYAPIVPRSDTWASRAYCYRTNRTEGHNMTTLDGDGQGGTYYQSLLEKAYDTTNEENHLQIKCYGIRAVATAEKLARLVILWRHRQLAMLSVDCSYNAADIEIGDKIGVTGDIVPSIAQSKTWLAIGTRLSPNVGNDPELNLNLIEMGEDIAGYTEWVETPEAAIVKTETPGAALRIEVGNGI